MISELEMAKLTPPNPTNPPGSALRPCALGGFVRARSPATV
jgi:hypothetical protein